MPTVEGYLTSFDGYALSGHELQLEGAFIRPLSLLLSGSRNEY